ncbi:hypothetical protein LCGC14_1123980 [marine sediment metagenome]|uniref:ParB-like N-terminal domain-containing protein n=1 Tax=marine sediment metagenome TaxID=412755 RepID=A0A0F9PLC9_9ZZZZ
MTEYIRRPYKVKAEKTKKPKVIHTLEGDMKAKPGDMIVTGRRGEKWPVKEEIFEESYRPVTKTILRLSDLKENPLNRDIDRDKVAEIKRAIIRTGLIKPLVYTEIMTDDGKKNMLTDGHHRYIALKEMGHKKAPAVMADERGIDTANKAKPEAVKKAKRKCLEGHYRDKDGKCRRRHRYGYGGGILVVRPKPPKNGNGNGNGESPPTNGVTKHTPGGKQHDQSTHTPKTRRAREAVAGTAEAGAIHLATLAIPAAVVGGLIRLSPKLGLGVIGMTAAFLLYEVPQLAFRMVEGGYRGYRGERPYRVEPQKMMKVGNRDVGGRTISRGDHALVIYQNSANVGVHLGGDVTRILEGKKLTDVRTTEKNRMKISTGEDIPSPRPGDAEKTKKVLNELIREQAILLNLASYIQREQKVTKHGTHDQSDHAPEPKVRREDIAQQTRSRLRASGGFKRLQREAQSLAASVSMNRPGAQEKLDRVMRRLEEIAAEQRRGIRRETKVVKHTPGGKTHNQQSHAGGRGGEKPDISVDTPDIATPAKLKTFEGVKNYLGRGTKVILSAERTELQPDENRRRSVSLKHILQNFSSDIVSQIWHEGENPIERSFIATPNDTKALNEIVNLAFDPSELKQESIIIIRNGVAEARYGDKRPSLYTTVSRTREVPSAKGYYSQLGNVRYIFDFKASPKTQTEKLVRAVEKIRDLAASMNKVGASAISVQGLGLVREDLGIRRKKRKSEKGWTTGRTIQLRRPVKNPDGHQIEGSRFP